MTLYPNLRVKPGELQACLVVNPPMLKLSLKGSRSRISSRPLHFSAASTKLSFNLVSSDSPDQTTLRSAFTIFRSRLLFVFSIVLLRACAADVPPAFPECPNDDGKTWATLDDASFKIVCQRHSMGSTQTPGSIIRSFAAGTHEKCLEGCAQEPKCLSADFMARAGSEKELPDHMPGDCILYNVRGGPNPTGACDKKTVDTAYLVDPPEEAEPDEAGTAYSTNCPLANGNAVSIVTLNSEALHAKAKQFDSPYGERFHIDCRFRHRSISISKCNSNMPRANMADHSQADEMEQPTLKDYMNACAALLACHSVDYHVSKRLCYCQYNASSSKLLLIARD